MTEWSTSTYAKSVSKRSIPIGVYPVMRVANYSGKFWATRGVVEGEFLAREWLYDTLPLTKSSIVSLLLMSLGSVKQMERLYEVYIHT